VTGTYRQPVSSSTTAWRVALLVLAIVLGLTNVVELAATFRPNYWDRFGLIGIDGSAVHDKLRASPYINRTALISYGRTSDARPESGSRSCWSIGRFSRWGISRILQRRCASSVESYAAPILAPP